MTNKPPVVARNEWLERRNELLREEKEFIRLRDRLSAKRRELPWVRVETPYTFEGETGRRSLLELFGARSQLAVYHFMFAPDWDVGCKSCSFWADGFDGIVAHLSQRDVAFVAVSRAPFAKVAAFKARMGWSFDWVSSFGTSFNDDFGVSFSPEQLASGAMAYNFGSKKAQASEMPGASTFIRDGDDVFHAYSAYSRGIDMLNSTYQWLDLAPKGRDEGDDYPMSWVKLRDQYVGL